MRGKAYTSYARGDAERQARPVKAAPVPPAAPKPEPPKPAFVHIGKPTPRVDGREIVTGRARYTHDVRLRGMLIGKILRSPRAAAEVVSIDLAPALAVPGVKAALKLADGKVRYAGQQVAAVAAVDERTAEKALALIKVEYKSLPSVVDWEKARDAAAPQVRDGKPNVDKLFEYSRGDVEKGFAEADVVVERTYRTGFEVHHPTETHGSVAAWEGDHLVVYDSTQNIHGVRDGLARALKVPAANVTVIKNYMGGGFGSKLSMGEYAVVAANLARECGRPVKVLLSRRDNAVCVGYRPSSHQTYKAGAKKDGTLTAFSLLDYASGGIVPGDEVAEPVVDLYRCPHCKVEEHTVFTNTGAQRAMRAPGHTQGAFGLESLMDELAAALDMDPLELRRKNYSTKNLGDTGLPYSSKGLDRCYEAGAKAIGWERRNRKPGEGGGVSAKGPLRRGIGMASSLWFGAGVPGTLADIVLYPDMSVEVVCGTQDLGTGTRTHMAVVAAETLGLEPKDITVKIGNSDYPWAPLSGGSLTAPSVAPAVRDAALKAVERLKAVAAARLKVDAGRRRHGGAEVLVEERSGQGGYVRRSLPRPAPGDGLPRRAGRHARRQVRLQHLRRPLRRSRGRYGDGHGARPQVRRRPGQRPGREQAHGREPGRRRGHPGPERRPLRGAGDGRRHRERRQPEPARLQDRDLSRHPGDHADLRRRRRPAHQQPGRQGPRRAGPGAELGGRRQRRLQRDRGARPRDPDDAPARPRGP